MNPLQQLRAEETDLVVQITNATLALEPLAYQVALGGESVDKKTAAKYAAAQDDVKRMQERLALVQRAIPGADAAVKAAEAARQREITEKACEQATKHGDAAMLAARKLDHLLEQVAETVSELRTTWSAANNELRVAGSGLERAPAIQLHTVRCALAETNLHSLLKSKGDVDMIFRDSIGSILAERHPTFTESAEYLLNEISECALRI